MTATDPSTGSAAEDVSAELRRMLDEHAITRLAARFYDAAMRRDVATFRSLWTADGVWEISAPNQGRWLGREEIGQGQQQFVDLNDFFFGVTLPGVFDVAGDEATARFGVLEIAGRGADSYRNVGLYEDELVRVSGSWLFRRRTYSFLWVDDHGGPLGGQLVGVPDRLTSPAAALDPDSRS